MKADYRFKLINKKINSLCYEIDELPPRLEHIAETVVNRGMTLSDVLESGKEFRWDAEDRTVTMIDLSIKNPEFIIGLEVYPDEPCSMPFIEYYHNGTMASYGVFFPHLNEDDLG